MASGCVPGSEEGGQDLDKEAVKVYLTLSTSKACKFTHPSAHERCVCS